MGQLIKTLADQLKLLKGDPLIQARPLTKTLPNGQWSLLEKSTWEEAPHIKPAQCSCGTKDTKHHFTCVDKNAASAPKPIGTPGNAPLSDINFDAAQYKDLRDVYGKHGKAGLDYVFRTAIRNPAYHIKNHLGMNLARLGPTPQSLDDHRTLGPEAQSFARGLSKHGRYWPGGQVDHARIKDKWDKMTASPHGWDDKAYDDIVDDATESAHRGFKHAHGIKDEDYQ